MMKIKICVIGLGYVGLPLAVTFSEKYKVIGYDINQKRVSELKNGVDKTDEVSPDVLNNLGESLVFVSNKDAIKDCNIYIVTVPTPIDTNNLPNLNFLKWILILMKFLALQKLSGTLSSFYLGLWEGIALV